MLEVHGRLYQLWRGMVSVYNNPSLNLATGVAYMDGRTTCADRLQAKGEGRHGAWLTAGGQATIQRSEIVACFTVNCNKRCVCQSLSRLVHR